MNHQKLFDTLEQVVSDPSLSEYDKLVAQRNLARLRETKVNILVTGATGAGKSSTINALFNTEVAKVGVGADPETMHIKKFELNNIILWDSPGLGDSPEKDRIHAKGIMNKLLEKDHDGNLLIDLVLVILEGATRDLGTSYELITRVIIPNLGEDKKRLLIAINQADVAMKGRGWDYEKNEPRPELVKFLDAKVESTRKRIKEATGVDVEPIYYSAGYKEGNEEQKPYNLSKLLSFLLRSTKKEKRVVFGSDINNKREVWEKDDELEDYQENIKQSFIESALEAIGRGLGKAIEAIVSPVTNVINTATSFISSSFRTVAGWFGL